MHVGTDLCARTNSCPSVNHGTFTNVSTDVDVRWHQNCVTGNERTFTYSCRWNNTDRFLFELFWRVVSKFQWYFVVILSAGTLQCCVIVDAEVQQNCLLHPLMHHPFSGDFFCYADLTGVQHVDSLQHRFTNNRIDAVWSNGIATLKCVINDAL